MLSGDPVIVTDQDSGGLAMLHLNVEKAGCGVVALLALFLAFQPPASAQQHLLGGDVQVGGFGSPVLKLGAVGGTTGLFVGGRAGLIVAVGPEQHLSIGGGVYGLMSGVRGPAPARADRTRYLQFGYGGLELEYLLRPDDVLHLSVITLIGAAQAGFDEQDRFDGHGFGHMWGGGWGRGGTFFVTEPGVNLTLNVAPFLRLSLGGSYRFVGGVRENELRAVELNGWASQLSLQLGRF